MNCFLMEVRQLSRRMKDSGFGWIGQIPEDWEISLLGNHFRERTERVSDFDYELLLLASNDCK